MLEKVVSDSSPLIGLFLIGRFSLLEQFYKKIIIPEAVWSELVEAEKEGTYFFIDKRKEGFLKVERVKPSLSLSLLHKELDFGEAEAIQLALDIKAKMLLLDEKEARSVARFCKLSFTGVVGILLRAKIENKIQSLEKELSSLEEKGFRIHHELKRKALDACNE